MPRCFAVACLTLLSVACAATPEPHRDSARAAPVASVAPVAMVLPPWQPSAIPSATDAAADPGAALARFLAYNVFRGDPADPDSLAECPPPFSADDEVQEGWEPDAYLGFVRPTVLGVEIDRADSTGRSATGRVALVRVASIDRGEKEWEGSMEAVPDTLTFTLQHAAAGWTVCGPVTKGAGVGVATFSVTWDWARNSELAETRWRPPGATWADVARHADSVRAGALR